MHYPADGGPLLLTELAIVFALILVNGIFAGAEIAVVSIRRTRVQQLADAGTVGAASLTRLRAQPERFLATVQIGITVVGTTAAAFGGAALARHLEPYVARVPWVADDAEEIALGLVVVVISYLSLVLGELVPKSLALRIGETYALLIAKPLLALAWLARPIVWFLTASSNLVLRPFSDRTNFMEAQISKEELQQMVEEAAESGALHEHTSEIASRALEFDKLTLRDVMIPRNKIDALPLRATSQQVRQLLLEDKRSRMPVYDGTLDNIVGYVSAKDISALAWENQLIVLQDLLRPIKVFPEILPAIDVLRFMRREHQRIVVSVDEHGALSGLVTFEDLVEELVGNFFSEDEADDKLIERDPDGSAVVRGEAPIREVNRELDIELEHPDTITTIAGLCTDLAGGIPHRGARLAANDGVVLIVLDATARAVRRIRVVPATSAEGGSPMAQEEEKA
jgi:putative hemolysin